MRRQNGSSAGGSPATAALIGFGAMAKHGHLPWFDRPGTARLIAIVEPSHAGRDAAAELRPDVRVYSSLAEMLEHDRPTFVDIAAPPSAHAALILGALAAGVHVFCEKPFVMSLDELAEIGRRRNESDLLVAACHNWYYAPAIQRALALLAHGRIGEPLAFTFIAERVRAATGSEHWQPDWRLSFENGGVIGDLGYHAFYLANRVMLGAPVEVRGTADHLAGNVEGGQSVASLELLYTGDRTARIELSWSAAAKRTEIGVEGRDGVCTITGEELVLRTSGGETREAFESLVGDSWHAGWTAGALDRFVRGLDSGDHDPAWHEIEGAVTALCAALRDTARSDG